MAVNDKLQNESSLVSARRVAWNDLVLGTSNDMHDDTVND